MRGTAGRRLCLMAMMWLLTMTATGCAFIGTASELYALPQMPEQYQELEEQIRDLIGVGAEYAAPVSGDHLQPVQMVDLDGDGTEEALIFMRESADEKPLKIYIFRLQEGHYRQTAVLENSGSSIYSIAYADLTGDGRSELLVGWRAGAENPALTIYELRGDEPELLLNSSYIRYVLDSAGRGFVLLRSGMDERCVAEAYEISEQGTLEVTSMAWLSSTAAELASGRVRAGRIDGGTAALFITGISIDATTALVDVLCWGEEGLKNVTLNPATGYTRQSSPFLQLFAQDIDNDGTTELPVPLLATEESGVNGLVQWLRIDEEGQTTAALQTYHNRDDGWYFTLPQSWEGKVSISRSVISAYETSVLFFYQDGTELHELFRLYTLKGENRELRANRDGRFRLRTQSNTVYAGELAADVPQELALDEETARGLFSLIVTDWSGGEN